MKLSIKIPLAFAVALLLMFAGALYGIFALNQSIDAYSVTVQDNVANERMVSATLVAFKLQVQEWKDTLLRGKDPAQLDKYWTAFQKRERTVDALAAQLNAKLPDGESRALIEKFSAAHTSMGDGYRKGFEAFKSAGFDPVAGDTAVAGVDREPSTLLEQAVKKISDDSAQVSAQAAIDARHATQISVVLMLVVLALSMIGGFLFSRTVSRPLGRALDCARAVATGDLSMDLYSSGKDEIAQLLGALKEMQASLSNVVARVRLNAEGVATASAEIAAGNLNLSTRTEEQAASLEETAASMEELTSTVRQNAGNAQQASALAGTASQTASRGGAMMGQVVETMQGITDSSNKVAEIISVIDAIAFQTNILALNAAVEAARAGEQGRGFAVVAGEVRTLAQRSATAAREIKELIAQSGERVNSGSALVGDAGQIIADIVGSVQRVNDIVEEISSASQEQSTGIDQVNIAVMQMDEVTQQNAALVEQASAAAQALSEQANSLRDAVAVFKLRDESMLGASANAVAFRPSASPRSKAEPGMDWQTF
ncbi:methyl-accepting chemotaxis protein-1, serine sensor receptor [Paraburkholderia fungorum]|uniref:Methyl-accepting chemotaxis protein-1, serine sensor receptor n=1 Tax=Paraburkholderia fungorum TaxID=134537 RepID=A0A1H1IVH6_9BURK|nr:methyl-accepting chemotaxis protein [Paraburkholderia fungorum]SDR41298.1 methyl-accepting chemotaxis protein-1, serine sensor receptor [Paraburkholderia fungorum]